MSAPAENQSHPEGGRHQQGQHGELHPQSEYGARGEFELGAPPPTLPQPKAGPKVEIPVIHLPTLMCLWLRCHKHRAVPPSGHERGVKRAIGIVRPDFSS